MATSTTTKCFYTNDHVLHTLNHKLPNIHKKTSTPLLTKPNQLKATLSTGHRSSGGLSNVLSIRRAPNLRPARTESLHLSTWRALYKRSCHSLVIHCHHRRPTPSDAAARLSLFLPGPSNYFAACVTPPTKTPPRFASSNAVITSNNPRGNPAVSQLTLGAARP